MNGMDSDTTISIPPETLELLQATALANQCTPEEIIRAAIEAFLDSDKEPESGSFES
jgi:predicted DNA-binding protein